MRVGLKGESTDASGDGGRGAGTRVLVGTDVVGSQSEFKFMKVSMAFFEMSLFLCTLNF